MDEIPGHLPAYPGVDAHGLRGRRRKIPNWEPDARRGGGAFGNGPPPRPPPEGEGDERRGGSRWERTGGGHPGALSLLRTRARTASPSHPAADPEPPRSA